MKISLEQIKDTFPMETGKFPNAESASTKVSGFSKVAAVLGSGGITGNLGEMTYEKNNTEWKEITDQMGLTDTDLQQMYMTVLSNTVSGEKLGELAENGYDLSELTAEDMVSILDHIKVAIMKSGTEIEGYTDTISKESLSEIVGDAAYANVLKQGISEKTMLYMLQNDRKPTPENLFKATYSVGSDKTVRSLDEGDEQKAYLRDENLQKQILQILSQAGMEGTKENLEDAKYLLKNDIPLTPEKLDALQKLKTFMQPQDPEEMKRRIAWQMERGIPAKDADLSCGESIWEEAVRLKQEVGIISDTALEETLEDGEGLTIRNLVRKEKAHSGAYSIHGMIPDEAEGISDTKYNASELEESKSGLGREIEQATGRSLKFVKARQQLEQVRLQMTVEANIRLLRSGFSIDTMPMEKLIGELEKQAKQLEDSDLMKAVSIASKVDETKELPIQTLGFVVRREIPFTVLNLSEKGKELSAEYQKAGQSYETMQTQIRADLGDSIKKAFQNTPALLAEMGMDNSVENQRAVRILGYNQISLSDETIQMAKSVDAQMQDLYEKLTPGRVLGMIREGIDPLSLEIPELNKFLEQMDIGFVETADEYAGFLQKLDRAGTITKEERNSFIGIYRLARQIQKSDGAALGFLLGDGERFTLDNLLHAVRSRKRKSLDYTIDDTFGGVDKKEIGNDIREQIQRGLSDKEAINFLQEYNQPVTPANITAVSQIMEDAAAMYNRILEKERDFHRRKMDENTEDELIREITDTLQEEGIQFTSEKQLLSLDSMTEKLEQTMENETTLVEGFQEFSEKLIQVLEQYSYSQDIRPMDIKELQGLCRQIKLSANLAKELFYQVPVPMENGYTVMNLHIRRGKNHDVPKAEISMQLPKKGSVCATIFVENEGTESWSIEDASTISETLREQIGQQFEENIRQEKASHLFGSGSDNNEAVTGTENVQTSTERLYILSKIFLETVRNSN